MAVNDLTIYDTLAEGWWKADGTLHMLARMNPARFAYFETVVAHWRGKRILDLGCGGGLAAACLAQRDATVVGVDLSRASLREAAHQTKGRYRIAPAFVCARGESLPFADASFDLVWCTDVLEHLADLPAVLAQIARLLKPGGILLYDTINRTWMSRLLAIWFWERVARLAPRGTHNWRLFVTPRELQQLLVQHGMQPGPIRGMFPLWGSPRQGWRFHLTRYTGVLYLGYAIKRQETHQDVWHGVSPLRVRRRRLSPPTA